MAKKGSPTMTKIAKTEGSTGREEPPIKEEAAAPQCRHYWLLEFPSGPTSRAVCKLCGATREFPNATDDYIYEEKMASTWKPGRRFDDEE